DAVRQQGDTAYLLLSVGEYLCNMSQAFTIEAGDVVMTGTPAGVGPLERGDQLKMVLNGKTQQFVWETFVKA
ncbi:fumarylacetoacetate hydrolase family protein, partial [Pseudomonas aeruginosa]